MILEKVVYRVFKKQIIPRWIIFLIDIGICLFSILLAYLLRFNFSIPVEYHSSLPYIVIYVLVVRAISFGFFRTYAGIIYYTTVKDVERIMLVIFFGTSVFFLVNLVSFFFIDGKRLIPTSILIIDYFIAVFVMSSSRLLAKNIYKEIKFPSNHKANVIIYGAGNLGSITKQTIEQDTGLHSRVVAFIEEGRRIGNTLEGVSIHSPKDVEVLMGKINISKFIFTKNPQDKELQYELIDICLKYNVQMLTIPPVEKWMNGELSMNQIRQFRIEDLLGRPTINLVNSKRDGEYRNQCVLITGAAGSIGSEIVRQIIRYRPKQLLLLDQAESPLYFLELEVSEKLNFKNIIPVLGDVSNEQKMNSIISRYKPQVIFHAAAYKHVPVLEGTPSEAVRVNIYGTKILAELAIKYRVEKFVMISTDKAVNPTNVMGASKRIAEIYTQSLNKKGGTKFITTRFGNVLGSNGSVIPRFREQIKTGGVVTVTHPEVTRYFMTIPEAVELVLEAGAMGKGGEIFLFDMGKSVKIVDLAKKMIKLSGLTLGADIQIKFTGLRPGEKLYEELLNNQENTLPTYHPKIMIAKVKKYDPETIQNQVDELIRIGNDEDPFIIVGKMKQIVPEYKSMNSIFEKIDK